jgi:L-asparaginase
MAVRSILADMKSSKRPRVAIVFTGGTISMRFDPTAGGPVPMLSGQEILAQVPGLDQIAECTTTDFARLPGPHMTPTRMLELSRVVAGRLVDEGVDGVVVTHGTDTLEETAYLLDLVLQSEKPVVFVGAMRNSSEPGWDGPSNLRSGVRVAADTTTRGLGVLVMMNDNVLSAIDATKTHTEAVDTFQGRAFGPLGLVDKDRVIVSRRRAAREHIPTTRLEERVEIIKLSAGSDGRLVRHAIEDGARGLVIEGLGRGNVPITALGEVERAIDTGMPVMITSRCPRGRVLDIYAYEGAGKRLKRRGAILGGMLPSHKARIKLMLMLGAGQTVDEIRVSFETTTLAEQ